MKLKLLKTAKLPAKNAVVLTYFEDDFSSLKDASLITQEQKKLLQKLINDKTLTGKLGSALSIATENNIIITLPLGKKTSYYADLLRQGATSLVTEAKKYNCSKITLDFSQEQNICFTPLIEGTGLMQYSFDKYKKEQPSFLIKEFNILLHKSEDFKINENLVNKAHIYYESCNWARTLADEPGNKLTPSILADKCQDLAKEHDLKINVLNEDDMAKENMNSLLAVSKGSEEEAKLIILEYKHKKAKKTVALVGKGLTFDAGGISLKPSRNMEQMKYDMCGAAAVLGAMKAIAQIKPEVNVICVVPSSENLPDGKAVKPGDVVTASNGKTIEIYNTDAEGRLILADALVYTEKNYKVDYMVDLATLTGACIVCLGHTMAGLITEDQELQQSLLLAGEQTHERLWPLPINDDYKDLLKGKHADLCNIGPPEAGTVTAGCFLSNFVDKSKWAHLDIAGVAWNYRAKYASKNYASGFGVRLLTKWVETL